MDGIHGQNFVEHCAKLWEVLGRIYDETFPHPARALREYQVPDDTNG
jgi:hypothetical protein